MIKIIRITNTILEKGFLVDKAPTIVGCREGQMHSLTLMCGEAVSIFQTLPLSQELLTQALF